MIVYPNLDILFKIFDTQGVAVQVFLTLVFVSNMLQDLQVFPSLLWRITRFQSQKLFFCYPTGSSIWREKGRKKSLASTRDFSLNISNVSSLNSAAKQSETALPVSLSLDSLWKGQVSTCSFCKLFLISCLHFQLCLGLLIWTSSEKLWNLQQILLTSLGSVWKIRVWRSGSALQPW